MDQATTLAPLSSAAAKEEVLGQIKLAKQNGATVVYGDEPIDHPGNFVMPTVLTNITKENPIYNQEIFGPVASIYKVDTEEEAIKLSRLPMILAMVLVVPSFQKILIMPKKWLPRLRQGCHLSILVGHHTQKSHLEALKIQVTVAN